MARGITDVAGLQNIKSLHSTGKRSIPRLESSAYLDIYMLQKEKERLEREIYMMEKRKSAIQKRLADIHEEMEVLQKSAQQERPQKVNIVKTKKEEKRWKRMALNY